MVKNIHVFQWCNLYVFGNVWRRLPPRKPFSNSAIYDNISKCLCPLPLSVTQTCANTQFFFQTVSCIAARRLPAAPATCALVIVCVLTVKNGRFFKRKVEVKGLPFVFTICACMWQNRLDDQTHRTKSPSSLLANTEALSAFFADLTSNLDFFFFLCVFTFSSCHLFPASSCPLFFFFFPGHCPLSQIWLDTYVVSQGNP